MASADNVRNLYQDGVVLGADQLTSDQIYVRAALERRSLARDIFGIAFGLELTIETAPPGASASSIVRVEPGVAYGGDGKPIVLRERTEVSSLLKDKDPSRAWAVYIAQVETPQNNQSRFAFCGQPMDARLAEEARLMVEVLPPSSDEREGARVAPHAQLGGPSSVTMNRVCLGVIDLDPIGPPSIRRVQGTVQIPEPETTPTKAALDAVQAPPAEAEYVGVVASGVAHPRAFTRSLGKDLVPAIELEPEGGIRLRERTRFEADAHATGMLLVDGTLVAGSGVAVVLPVESGITAISLRNKAVAWRTNGVGGARATFGTGKSESERVLGIATEVWPASTEQVVVVFSGMADVEVDGAMPDVGGWLDLSGTEGKLKDAGSPATIGKLVGKMYLKRSANVVQLLVSLG